MKQNEKIIEALDTLIHLASIDINIREKALKSPRKMLQDVSKIKLPRTFKFHILENNGKLKYEIISKPSKVNIEKVEVPQDVEANQTFNIHIDWNKRSPWK